MVDHFLLFAALRCGYLDLVPRPDRKRLAQQFGFLDRVGKQQEPGAGLVVIELREKRTQHFCRLIGFVRPGEIGPVAPVLSRSEEKHLDAGHSALLGHGKDIGLVHATRIDTLMCLHMRQRR